MRILKYENRLPDCNRSFLPDDARRCGMCVWLILRWSLRFASRLIVQIILSAVLRLIICIRHNFFPENEIYS